MERPTSSMVWPIYAVCIALMDKKEVILGVVYEVNRDECFYAIKGGGVPS